MYVETSCEERLAMELFMLETPPQLTRVEEQWNHLQTKPIWPY